MHSRLGRRQQGGPKTAAWATAAVEWQKAKKSVDAVQQKQKTSSSHHLSLLQLTKAAQNAIGIAARARDFAHGQRNIGTPESKAAAQEANARRVEIEVMTLWHQVNLDAGVTHVKPASKRVKKGYAAGRFSK